MATVVGQSYSLKSLISGLFCFDMSSSDTFQMRPIHLLAKQHLKFFGNVLKNVQKKFHASSSF